MADLMTLSENCTTCVLIASRSRGGVSMTDISRIPSSDIFSVRGIGVARKRQNIDFLFQLFQFFLVRDAETLFFIDDDQAQLRQLHIVRQNAVRADQNIDLAFLGCFDHCFLFFG